MEITESEFKELFKLDENCTIPKDSLKLYNKQVRGAYLIYKDVLNISKTSFKNVDGTKLHAYFKEFSYGFQRFVHTYGSSSTFNVSYIDNNRSGSTPFWTHTKYSDEEVVQMKNSAYRMFESCVLFKLKYKYFKYGFEFSYIDYATTGSEERRCHPNGKIWWDGLTFQSLFFRDSKGNMNELYDRDIRQTICNYSNIWNGDIASPIQRIIDGINDKLKVL
jgi:hypothetical protein